MLKGVIFDFDGTLTELTLDFGHLRKEIEKVARKYTGDDAIRAREGQYIIEMIRGLEADLGEKAAEFSLEAFDRLRVLELEASKGKDVYPYTRDVLRRLKDKGIKVGILTRSHLDILTHVFPDIEEYVQVIVTRHDVDHVKPHPNHAAETLRALGLRPDEALLAGDHPTDILGGRAFGVKTVGVLAGRTARADFEKVGATYIFEDVRGIIDIL